MTKELHYPIDLIGKYVWFLLSIGILHPQYVIKTEAEEFKLQRI